MAKAVLSEQAAASTQNIYQLDGKVPLLKAIPFGLQHILAMFVANLTPITLIGAASGLDHAQIAVLLQNAMFVAGIATLIQLYPIWKIGSRLPVVMGVSFTLMTGAVCMMLAGLLPPVGNFFASLPESVLGGCTLMMFGTIMVSGIQMISKAGFSQRNVTIVALSLAVGIGFTSASEMDIWRIFPQVIQDVFSANCVAVVFVMSILLSALLPKDMEIKRDVNTK